MVAGIEANWFQGEIADAAYRFQRKVSADRMVIVGVNGFTGGNEDGRAADPDNRARGGGGPAQAAGRGAAARRTRRCRAALARLADDADHAERNLMPAVFEAVRAYATVGR